MEFDTGSRPDPTGSGGSGGGTGVRPPGMSASAGGEFNLSDPVKSFVWTVRSLVTAPAAFFRGMPRNAGLKNPLAFAVICSFIAAAPAALLVLLFSLVAGISGDAASALGGIVGAFVVLLLYPIGTVIGLFVGAGIYHLLVLLLLRPANAGFGATFRVASYGSFPNVLGFLFFIPILNILAGLAIGVYTVILYVLGVREAHATTTGKAALVVLAPVAVGIALSIVFTIIGVLIAAAAGQ
ncbi:MAG TPA: YIP1 family protein [Rubrobacter sp.]|nr:YIP1 family protein [Rubrobacter sp.]